MPPNEKKRPSENFTDKLRAVLGLNASPKTKDGLPPQARFSIWYFLVAILLFSYLQPLIFSGKVETIPYSRFKQHVAEGNVVKLTIGPDNINGTLAGSPGQAFTTIRVDDPDLVKDLDAQQVSYSGRYENKFLSGLLSWIFPLVIFFLIWRYAMKKMGSGMGVMSFSKSKAKIFAENDTKVSFADVAGIDEAREELQEVVEFLSTPEKSQKLGGRIPKGVLLVGPPGTGKTLLARAVAGEAMVPFFSISGSEFVEMFVGVGAARVRDLFSQAAAKAPCIIFIDELDALGKARGMNVMGGHDEREQTLNQLLVEMDGFETNKGVIIMAATNRPEILDPALLRPGRFDRQVLVDRPDINGREAILKIHSRHVVLGPEVDLRKLAGRTPGFVGADLANIINEAALLAARNDKETVELTDFDEAIDRVIAGLQKKNRVMNAQEKEIVAFHESGHAIVAESVEHADPVHKISIIPRGIAALGYTQQQPTEDRYLMTRSELIDRLAVLLGGRVAEEVVFNEISTGAQNDLQRASGIARSMVMEYGMSDRLGLVNYERPRQSMFLPEGFSPGKNYSEAMATQIDEEVTRIIEEAHQRVRKILLARRTVLDDLARLLSHEESVQGDELRKMLSASPLGVAASSSGEPSRSIAEKEDDDSGI
ncbi:ATP-dependent zinc metalloprotease FtsH [Desulfococcus multivorans]|uniref:ATP-dependent zinc metalloprotease FtsH n=1 Tax=Desulfococcus multivorans DSM 2059 TaxID=1121405 RepID=S7V8D6_DESML|nr:ATP-dependent zinc metalloprotease FtsH [Desulfococcus multivorans]AOY56939.1 FtsH1: cell division protease [Desulfococcus multivorans]AQU99467.1 cell division protein FtsH [Desulfococcus multivorans]EPR40803.1 peptidase M41 FtsH domain protein [Desulfococcus multivorans DSM 2059]SKA20953.1 membrane protease FtsH catalytic subunit [Desulfococcus multivorans DSM 2059]